MRSPESKKEYNHSKIEKKWQKEWAKKNIYKTEDNSKLPKYYALDMFPYPSGEGLHVGHPKGYIATDVVSRMKRMKGFNVLHPMGFDAFGLPAEQYAIKMKTNPAVAVAKNVEHYKEQLEKIGFDYDWSREVNTTDPNFYKWTQWIFLKLLENGLAKEAEEPINWCPVDKTGLANEDVENGRCERCGALVEKKLLRQWVLKITDYAERLLEDLDAVDTNGVPILDWPKSIKDAQKNWIGKSEGYEIDFEIAGVGLSLTIFTTRPETIFGVTYVVLAPERKMVQELLGSVSNKNEVQKYIDNVKAKSDIDRSDMTKDKTGVQLKGIAAINPANNKEVPVWLADYVLGDYGTGAVMAVPEHDERDKKFSLKYNLPIKVEKFADEGLIKKIGKKVIKYKLKDWVFSRQRYWGEPIPVLHDNDGNIIPVAEKDLPVVLPKVKFYEPTGTGESPLANIKSWVEVKVGKRKSQKILKRETNTMPQWAGSSWYYLRYMDPDNKKKLVDPKKEQYWKKTDLYVGGAEHATRHLIYARFWHKFLYDIGVVSTIEPFYKLRSVGLILAEDGRKMSKRWGNVINPDDVIERFGADTMRVYEMFMGPFDQSITWSTDSMVGSRRFLERVWRMKEKVTPSRSATTTPQARRGKNEDNNSLLHKAIKKVSEDIEEMHFNTAISTLMILSNEMEKAEEISKNDYEIFLKLLAPFAPHITDELWHESGNKSSIHTSKWPEFDPNLVLDEQMTIVIQVNGKTRDTVKVSKEVKENEIKDIAMDIPNVKKWLESRLIKKVIYVPGRVMNFIVDDNTL